MTGHRQQTTPLHSPALERHWEIITVRDFFCKHRRILNHALAALSMIHLFQR
jgi:hypothetical protein